MKSTKILVVEDESIVAKDLQNRLKKFGYNVPSVAHSGEEAIQQVGEICPDLVLMDIRLQGEIDGIEAAIYIYNHFRTPVIYLTAYADDTTLERAKLSKPFGYILKPFKERELYTNIEIAITKSKLDKQLKENQKWLRTIITSIGDGVIATNNQELITFMNPVAEKLTGWKQEEALGQRLSEVFKIFNSENHNIIENPVKKVLQENVVINLEKNIILTSRNGLEIPIDDSAAPIKDDQDNIMGAVLVFRDISERQRAVEARQKQIEQEQRVAQLEQLNQLKDNFLNTVSHELRTPLSNIMMAIQILQTADTKEESQRYLEILQTECDRELELINDLLDLQRVEATTTPLLIPEPLLLQYWLPSIIESFSVRTKERQQTLKLNLPFDTPPLISDNASLARIFVELLNNACKYTPAGGKIILSVYHQSSSNNVGEWRTLSSVLCLPQHDDSANESRLASNEFSWEPPSIIFTISNSAEIPADALPRIFDKFYRVPNADIWQQRGTGLGLALVQKLVEQLQGTIQVESSAGWTTFTLRFRDLDIS